MRQLLLTCGLFWLVSADFEPYQSNGGLIAGVSGRNFVVLASDTRLLGPGGYDILTRNYQNRLWMATEGSKAEEKIENTEFDDDMKVFDIPPVWIASAGCNADSEMLKRLMQSDLRRAQHFSGAELQPHQVATALSQTLYTRRTFPYYSFCIVAGLTGKSSLGSVHVYDAIGSFEAVAVATAGTGRDLLQAILDQAFSSEEVEAVADGRLIAPVAPLQVSASLEETVRILVKAYRSVSERDIQVGDSLILVCMEKLENGHIQCRRLSMPLKEH